MIKFAYHSGSFYQDNITEVVKNVSSMGYDAIELNAEKYTWEKKEPHITPNINGKEIKDLKEIIMNNGIEISAISAHTPLLHEDERNIKEAIEFTKNFIIIASKLNVNIVHGLSGKKPSHLSDKEAMNKLVNILSEIQYFAEQHNIRFAIEPIAGMFINNSSSLISLKEKLNKKLYINMDVSNIYVTDKNIEEFLEKFGNDIVHIHIKDAIGTEKSFDFPPLGEGNVNFLPFIETLEKINYSGFLSVEYVGHAFGYQNSVEQTAKDSLVFLNDLYKNLRRKKI